MNYKTPNIYIEEIPSFPPSVVAGATAVPAFVGYTEKAGNKVGDISKYHKKPVRITSMVEYENIFGKAYFPQDLFKIDTSNTDNLASEFQNRVKVDESKLIFLLYYQLQMYFANGGGVCYIVSVGQYNQTQNVEDINDGLDALEKEDEPTLIVLTDAISLNNDYYDVCNKALSQCEKLKDRFVILDVPLLTQNTEIDYIDNFRDTMGNSNLKYGAAYYPYLSTNLRYFYEDKQVEIGDSTLEEYNKEPEHSKLYSEIKAELDQLRVTLPPSGAIAGIYASVDRDRGIWKAPANVSINAVIEPTVKVTDSEQENLNVHDSGKSINVIRSFTGKGTLVWGSRTLAGNDNEWRYIPVRRLFNLIEKSIKRSTSFAVFEPNTEMTWLKVRVMIENYLNDLWKQGALAGSKAEDAYFVQVGLGKTMTAQDILEGKMIAKIGIAAVRPAEFVIMQFSHLLQKS